MEETRTDSSAVPGLRAVSDVLAIFREFDPLGHMPIQTAHVFTVIAINQGCSLSFIEDTAGISQSAASRNVLTLAEGLTERSQGLGLVSGHEDPEDSRRKLVYLTRRGYGVAKRLLAVSLNVPEADVSLRHVKPYTPLMVSSTRGQRRKAPRPSAAKQVKTLSARSAQRGSVSEALEARV